MIKTIKKNYNKWSQYIFLHYIITLQYKITTPWDVFLLYPSKDQINFNVEIKHVYYRKYKKKEKKNPKQQCHVIDPTTLAVATSSE